MSNDLKVVKKSADPAVVRAWLRENGFNPGSRGRFSPEEIAAYNAAHKGFGSYKTAGYKPVAVKEVRVKGKSRKVPVPAARKVLREAGYTVGARGRLSTEQVLTALELVSKRD